VLIKKKRLQNKKEKVDWKRLLEPMQIKKRGKNHLKSSLEGKLFNLLEE
jgi:hypothetical protein